MTDALDKFASTARLLGETFLRHYPEKAARHIESMHADDAAELLQDQPFNIVAAVWPWFAPGASDGILSVADDEWVARLLYTLDITAAVALLGRQTETRQTRLLSELSKTHPGIADELRELLTYPANTAGRIMNSRVQAFNEGLTVAEVLRQLRQRRVHSVDNLFLLNNDKQLVGFVPASGLLLAERTQVLSNIAGPIKAWVSALDPKSEVLEKFDIFRVNAIPVLDANEQLIGVIESSTLYEGAMEDLATDMQTMVGASKDERALSSSWFSVRKRLPWLYINLLTAFAAAAVVGAFEGIIAQFTALAILLPVVAGQSGNAGAQSLAITMRGLTLREVTTRHWLQLTFKEVRTGFVNGVAIAVACALGVWVWSRSLGLALVIGLSMVMSLIIASAAGTLVPIALKKFGQDPAQSSSIVLTTVTDIAGFMSFLGIATLLSDLLVSG